MGFITELLKDIPLSAVVKEQLIIAEKEIIGGLGSDQANVLILKEKRHFLEP